MSLKISLKIQAYCLRVLEKFLKNPSFWNFRILEKFLKKSRFIKVFGFLKYSLKNPISLTQQYVYNFLCASKIGRYCGSEDMKIPKKSSFIEVFESPKKRVKIHVPSSQKFVKICAFSDVFKSLKNFFGIQF